MFFSLPKNPIGSIYLSHRHYHWISVHSGAPNALRYSSRCAIGQLATYRQLRNDPQMPPSPPGAAVTVLPDCAGDMEAAAGRSPQKLTMGSKPTHSMLLTRMESWLALALMS